jgi:hypothetical protein
MLTHQSAGPLAVGALGYWTFVGVVIVLVCAGWMIPAAGELPQRKAVNELPSVQELPDPFLLADGSRIKSPEQWRRHREELAGLVLAYEYGALPPAVTNVKGNVTSIRPTTRPAEMPGAAEVDVVLTMGPRDKVTIHLHLFIPAGAGQTAENKGPFPLIIRGDLGWGPVKPDIAAAVVERGYILAERDRTELAADKKNTQVGGVYDAWPDYEGSALGAWAWGYHRVVDYMLMRADVDAKHIAITGHSRGGKTVLLAGALDERIALTAPNDSGCGGAGCYRFQGPKSEAIENITKAFPYWFEPHFPEFIGKVDRLPIDQHTVKALVAPRALLETEALGDLWANPQGSQQTYLAAKEVFEFMSAGEQIGIAWREGKHEQNITDWIALLDFADWRFFGKRPGRSYETLAFPETKRAFGWAKP